MLCAGFQFNFVPLGLKIRSLQTYGDCMPKRQRTVVWFQRHEGKASHLPTCWKAILTDQIDGEVVRLLDVRVIHSPSLVSLLTQKESITIAPIIIAPLVGHY